MPSVWHCIPLGQLEVSQSNTQFVGSVAPSRTKPHTAVAPPLGAAGQSALLLLQVGEQKPPVNPVTLTGSSPGLQAVPG